MSSDQRTSAEAMASWAPSGRGARGTATNGDPVPRRTRQRKSREADVDEEENYDTCPSDSEEHQVRSRVVDSYVAAEGEWIESEEEISPGVRSRVVRKDDPRPHLEGPSEAWTSRAGCYGAGRRAWADPKGARSRPVDLPTGHPDRTVAGKWEDEGMEVTKGYRREQHKQPALPHVKLGAFKGDSCLETFLAKFENLSAYVGWSARDRLFHLQASLEGAAGQVLWDAGQQTSAEEIVRRLRARFGNDHQAERFRAELRNRRRKSGETLQAVYNDVCRLLALAYPGPSNATTAIVGRDAFLDALNNNEMRIKVLEREPSTLEEALSIVCRLEAYERVPADKAVEEMIDEDRGRNRVRHARQLQVAPEPDARDRALEQITRQLSELRKIVDCQNAERRPRGPPEAASHVGAWSQPTSTAPEAAAADIVGQNPYHVYPPPEAAPRRNKGRGGLARSGCFQCGDPTHWKNECPYRRNQLPTAGPEGSRVGVISAQSRPAEIYVDVTIEGVSTLSILDTGCERSIIGRRLIPNVPLTDTSLRLFAVNGSAIPLAGSAVIEFEISGRRATANVVVTDALDELILGIDWLAANWYQWDFGEATLHFNGCDIPVYKRPTRTVVRRIYVIEDQVVEPGGQSLLAVRIVRNGLREPLTDWLCEPRPLQRGVVVARTFMNGQSTRASIRV